MEISIILSRQESSWITCPSFLKQLISALRHYLRRDLVQLSISRASSVNFPLALMIGKSHLYGGSMSANVSSITKLSLTYSKWVSQILSSRKYRSEATVMWSIVKAIACPRVGNSSLRRVKAFGWENSMSTWDQSSSLMDKKRLMHWKSWHCRIPPSSRHSGKTNLRHRSSWSNLLQVRRLSMRSTSSICSHACLI